MGWQWCHHRKLWSAAGSQQSSSWWAVSDVHPKTSSQGQGGVERRKRTKVDMFQRMEKFEGPRLCVFWPCNPAKSISQFSSVLWPILWRIEEHRSKVLYCTIVGLLNSDCQMPLAVLCSSQSWTMNASIFSFPDTLETTTIWFLWRKCGMWFINHTLIYSLCCWLHRLFFFYHFMLYKISTFQKVKHLLASSLSANVFQEPGPSGEWGLSVYSEWQGNPLLMKSIKINVLTILQGGDICSCGNPKWFPIYKCDFWGKPHCVLSVQFKFCGIWIFLLL